MKGFAVSIFSLLAFLLFCSKSCETDGKQGAGNKESELMSTLDSITGLLSAEKPSGPTLRLLEVKARQKLADLSDYLQIFVDSSLDGSFRAHAGTMISDLFISDSVRISLVFIAGTTEQCMSLHDLLRSGPGRPGHALKFTFDSIVLEESLHRTDDRSYTGRISFIQQYRDPSSSSREISFSVKKEVDITAEKVAKTFGSDTLKIWSVLLGDIR